MRATSTRENTIACLIMVGCAIFLRNCYAKAPLLKRRRDSKFMGGGLASNVISHNSSLRSIRNRSNEGRR